MLNWNLQWLDHNSQRAYPLTDWATKKDQSEQIVLPDSFLLALYLPISTALNLRSERFYIRHVGIFPTGYSITVGYDDGTKSIPAAVGHISKADHKEFQSYALSGIGIFDESVGRCVIGKLDAIDQLPPGLYTFDYEATCLEVDAIWPQIRGVSSLTVVNGNDATEKLYGDIMLVAGENIRLTFISNQFGQRIRIDAIGGENLNEYCECEPEPNAPPIRFINGVAPDEDGNFTLLGTACVKFKAIENGIQIVEECATPCCGCNELEALIQQIQRTQNGATTLHHFVTNLEMVVSQMTRTLLGSRTGEVRCMEL